MARFSIFSFQPKPTMAHSPKSPFVKETCHQIAGGSVCTPLDNLLGLEEPFEASFQLPNGLKPRPSHLLESFLPDLLIWVICFAFNQCARMIPPQSQVEVITEEEILCFLVVHHCMGVVVLPSKNDCWRTEANFWPVHPIVAPLACNQCKCIWRTIRLSHSNEVDVEDPAMEGFEDDDEEEDSAATDSRP